MEPPHADSIVRSLRRRWLHILVCLWQGLWLFVILPGHTRGQIVLPGYEKTPAAAGDAKGGAELVARASCCSMRRDAPAGGKTPPVDRGRTENCAVCHFAARLSQAVAFVLFLPPPARLEILPPDAPVVAHVAADLRTVRSRAPPLV